jgi:hypothetical protein
MGLGMASQVRMRLGMASQVRMGPGMHRSEWGRECAGQNGARNGFAGQNGAGNGFTGGIGLVCEWEWEWLTALQVVIASHMGTASHTGITS